MATPRRSSPMNVPGAPRGAPIPEPLLIKMMSEAIIKRAGFSGKRTRGEEFKRLTRESVTERFKALTSIIDRAGSRNISLEDFLGTTLTRGSSEADILKYAERFMDIGGKALDKPGFGQGIVDVEQAAQRRRSNARLALRRRRFFDTGSDPAGA